MTAKKRKERSKNKSGSKLAGLDLSINTFGKVVSNLDVDEINSFLDRSVHDRKLSNRGAIHESGRDPDQNSESKE